MTRYLLYTSTVIDVTKGQAIHTTDALVAAVARHRQAIVVTSNLKDFPRTGIRVVSFRT